MRSTWCCSRSAPLQLLYGEPVDENDRSDQNRSAGICACAYPDLAITRRVEVHFANIFSIAHARGVGTSCARFGRLDLDAICRAGLRMVLGWVLASFVGILIGAAIGSSRLARDLLEPTLDFIRPLPASAMIPVAVLFLGLSNAMSLAVIAFGAIWPVLRA